MREEIWVRFPVGTTDRVKLEGVGSNPTERMQRRCNCMADLVAAALRRPPRAGEAKKHRPNSLDCRKRSSSSHGFAVGPEIPSGCGDKTKAGRRTPAERHVGRVRPVDLVRPPTFFRRAKCSDPSAHTTSSATIGLKWTASSSRLSLRLPDTAS